MTQAVLDFTLDLERIAELAVMLVIGSLLSTAAFTPQTVAVALFLIFVARPLAVYAGDLARALDTAPAPVCGLVRHPRHRLDVLPELRRGPWCARGRASRFVADAVLVTIAVVGAGARIVGDAVDAPVRQGPVVARALKAARARHVGT